MVKIMSPREILRASRIGVLLVCCACQHYIDMGAAAPVPAGDARLTLSDHGSSVQYGAIGSGVRQVEGKIQSVDDSTIAIAVTGVARQMGFNETWPGATVKIARSDVTRVESRKLSMPRTLVTIGGFIAGGLAVTSAINGGESTSSGLKKSGNGN
jgi:hypothetical protein